MVDSRAKRRLALLIAATVTLAAFAAKPLYACEPTGCPTGAQNLGNTAANALPTYPQPTEEAAAPVPLKKFTKPQTRTARYAQTRKATLSQRARAGKYASRSQKQIDREDAAEAPVRAKAANRVALAVADANAELVEPDAVKAEAAPAGGQARPVASETPASADNKPPAVDPEYTYSEKARAYQATY